MDQDELEKQMRRAATIAEVWIVVAALGFIALVVLGTIYTAPRCKPGDSGIFIADSLQVAGCQKERPAWARR